MNSKRFFFIMLAMVASLIAVFAGGVYKASSMLKAESDELIDLKLTSSVLDRQRDSLDQAKRDIAEFSELEELTKSIVPQEKDQANTIGEIASHAQTSGIRLGAIQFPQSELGQVTRGKAKSPSSADSDISQLLPLEDLKGVYVMGIDVRNHSDHPVKYEQIIQFLSLLESNRRTAQVIDISIQPDDKIVGAFHFSTKLNTYIRPE